MTKYIIEGNTDFFNELYKSLDNDENEHKTDADNNLCLITNQPLTEMSVKMTCGHKFNYVPLYLDIKNHKLKFNQMEKLQNRLKTNEIRCPYCRNTQTGLLPYYECLNLAQIHGVNYINPDHKVNSSSLNSLYNNYNMCNFLIPNLQFNKTLDASYNLIVEADASGNVVGNVEGNFQFNKCGMIGTPINYVNNYGDDQCYCYNHKKTIIKKYKKNISDKAKDAIKQQKLQDKLAAIQLKEDTKQNALNAKIQAKELLKQSQEKKVKTEEEHHCAMEKHIQEKEDKQQAKVELKHAKEAQLQSKEALKQEKALKKLANDALKQEKALKKLAKKSNVIL